MVVGLEEGRPFFVEALLKGRDSVVVGAACYAVRY